MSPRIILTEVTSAFPDARPCAPVTHARGHDLTKLVRKRPGRGSWSQVPEKHPFVMYGENPIWRRWHAVCSSLSKGL